MVDTTALRTKMVDGQVRPSDVTDHRIIAAMSEIPREAFVPGDRPDLAYLDRDAPVGRGRFLLKPMVLSRMIQAAGVTAGDVALEVGGATGYGAAVLARLAGSVFLLEEDAGLADAAQTALSANGAETVVVARGTLATGHAAGAPYDVILVSGAVDEVPAALFAQLREGGRLVAVVGHGHAARAMLYTRSASGLAGRVVMNAAAEPLPGLQAEPAFTF